jgi:hypothetical protein
MDAATTASPRSLDDYYEIHELEPGTRATVAGLTAGRATHRSTKRTSSG